MAQEPDPRKGKYWDLPLYLVGEVRLMHDYLNKPLKRRTPTVWAVWNDLFHKDVPRVFIATAFARMYEAGQQQTFLILTKRPERMARVLNDGEFVEQVCNIFANRVDPHHEHGDVYFEHAMVAWPFDNAWLGTTAGTQKSADERIPELLRCPAAVRYLSIEPMLEAIDLSRWIGISRPISLIIAGAETGPGARWMKHEWAEGLRNQCLAANVPFFFKRDSYGNRQLGGREWNEFPERAEIGDDNAGAQQRRN